MSTPDTVANFNGQRPVIDPDDAAMLLIDHQSGLFQVVKDLEFAGVARERRHAREGGDAGEYPGDYHRLRTAGTKRAADSRNP